MERNKDNYSNHKNNITITSLIAKVDQINAWERDLKIYNNDYMAEQNAFRFKEIISLINIIVLALMALAYNLTFHTTFMLITIGCMMVYVLSYAISACIPLHKSAKNLRNHTNLYPTFITSLVGSETFEIRIDSIVNIMTMETLYYEVYANCGDGFKHIGNINDVKTLHINSLYNN